MQTKVKEQKAYLTITLIIYDTIIQCTHIMETCSTVAWADNSKGSKIALLSYLSYYYRILVHYNLYSYVSQRNILSITQWD